MNAFQCVGLTDKDFGCLFFEDMFIFLGDS